MWVLTTFNESDSLNKSINCLCSLILNGDVRSPFVSLLRQHHFLLYIRRRKKNVHLLSSVIKLESSSFSCTCTKFQFANDEGSNFDEKGKLFQGSWWFSNPNFWTSYLAINLYCPSTRNSGLSWLIAPFSTHWNENIQYVYILYTIALRHMYILSTNNYPLYYIVNFLKPLSIWSANSLCSAFFGLKPTPRREN